MRCDSGLMMTAAVPMPMPLRGAGSEGRGLAQAGDVGAATGGRHDALGVAQRDVVVHLGSRGNNETKEEEKKQKTLMNDGS